eukprot:TRINITY_DN3222_c1_g3_i2.p1 TRINITY_DN3222_c1_g3~~TRINITY_DN3222_c1_g3_i2.p1  ORF type:complete len:639 (+),score=127.10 TRINITY_DN3222_c1_g3_i2:36-1919(+)
MNEISDEKIDIDIGDMVVPLEDENQLPSGSNLSGTKFSFSGTGFLVLLFRLAIILGIFLISYLVAVNYDIQIFNLQTQNKYQVGSKVQLTMGTLFSSRTGLKIVPPPQSLFKTQTCPKLLSLESNFAEKLSGDLSYLMEMGENYIFVGKNLSLTFPGCKVKLPDIILPDRYEFSFEIDNMPLFNPATVGKERALSTHVPATYQNPDTLILSFFQEFNIQMLYNEQKDGIRIIGGYIVPVLPTSESSDDFSLNFNWIKTETLWNKRWKVMSVSPYAKYNLISSIEYGVLLIVSFVLLDRLYSAKDKDLTQGYKSLHGDVFRQPPMSLPLFVIVGTSAQLTLTIILVLLLSSVGLISHANHGSFIGGFVFTYMVTALFGSYIAHIIRKAYDHKGIKRLIMMLLITVPGIFIGIVALRQMFTVDTAYSLEFPSFILLVFFGAISAGFSFLGTFLGHWWFPKELFKFPTSTRAIPRTLPNLPFFEKPFVLSVIVGITLAFLAMPLHYMVLNSWLYSVPIRNYALLFFNVILFFAVASVLIVYVIFLLLSNFYYQWQWIPIIAGISYQIVVTVLHLTFLSSKMSSLWSLGVLVNIIIQNTVISVPMAGGVIFCGFISCLWFLRQTYASVRVK